MTIVDIAKESGYSVTTVSRVLNDRKDVSPEARKKIMEIVEAHGFVPNNNVVNKLNNTSLFSTKHLTIKSLSFKGKVLCSLT